MFASVYSKCEEIGKNITQLYGPLGGTYFVMDFISKTLTDCRAMSINTEIGELQFLRKKTSNRHDIIKIGNIYFMLAGKLFGDSQSSEDFDDILLD